MEEKNNVEIESSLRMLERVPERGLHSKESRKIRVDFLEQKTGLELSLLSPHQLVSSDLKKNIEGFIGAVEIPVGVAGPLHIKGTDFEETVYAPVATSEGLLVVSISRGANAINLSGGVKTRFIRQRMNRVSVFNFRSMNDAYYFAAWCESKIDQLKAVAKKYSCFAEMISIKPQITGSSTNLKFVYKTGDAAGQNMTTTCTWHVCQWIEKHWKQETNRPLESYLIDGNGSSDKKVSFMNYMDGRGCEVVAECEIPGEIVKKVLKVSSYELYRV